ncbi:5-methyltetrahydropteroyltriglutamate--homocysteine S-methyltransferase [Alkalicoccobacillus porphyridii]|uniref:5-methyltetrahydropteroyltriglutamate--homocysteine methyltransferase n=1 Tax=Alkalicoccobacillus porphyridii TaxID=2597270 RepID=A0A553ZTK6_9BACI|nr:5-methyltetrahydropteroyltriglutamate--homocysteine S-methyltransferase [Alkalicoccobacillus porphyridii]TSB44811.1 5-methyltetrahydropteroyltriglutamate--homocysteine S-methyltransferase [Alkalicoccobacillus porphyridii]
MPKVRSSNIGYPRIGEKREWKKSLEQFWAGNISEQDLLESLKSIRLTNIKKQTEAGIDLVPVGDFSFYDQVLDTAVSFGLVPDRFDYNGGKVDVTTYFAIARGTDSAVAAEMTKWYNTNYHYIVPEISTPPTSLVHNRVLELFNEAKEELGTKTKPVIIGPVSFVKLSKNLTGQSEQELVRSFIPLYATLLKELEEADADWVQIEEPFLNGQVSNEDLDLLQEVYAQLDVAAPSLNILLQTYFEAIDDYEAVVNLPVQGLGLDFVHDEGVSLEQVKKFGFPTGKVLAAGIIDGRNIWRADLKEVKDIVDQLSVIVGEGQLILQPSCSLLHVPVTVELETELPELLKEGIAFADEKLQELVALTKVANDEQDEESLEKSSAAVKALNESSSRNNEEVRSVLATISEEIPTRTIDAPERLRIQQEKYQLPLLPTTTIGSFPQTKEVRQQRLKWRKGELNSEDYEKFIRDEIDKWIKIQEELDLDVLVHGEFERTDMVEFFGEKLAGFQFTKFGWVQSYGSRCVKPPIIYGDVAFVKPMTVKETAYAQRQTKRPVKGMLTGPVTIFNWSFPRTDIPEGQVVNQIALALRKEVEELEREEIGVIQVDEPAIREGLPLKPSKTKAYLDQSVGAFRLSTNTVQTQTQIHTHMCYSDFEAIIESIDALDADVISIETSRSHGELISAFEDFTYNKGIGLGVYDIHSPRVPAQEEIDRNISRALSVLDPKLFWINPDCGLKTRKEKETVEALRVMVNAAKEARKQYVTSPE